MREQKPNSSWAFEIDKIESWAYMNNVFTPEECDKIIEYGKSFALKQATTRGQVDEEKVKEIRDSKVVFLAPEMENQWIFQRMTDAAVKLNEDYFKFDLFGFIEGFQFTEYTAPGQRYDYHVDRGYNTTIRKLSIVVQLTDSDSYAGGFFELWQGGKEPKQLPRTKGTMLAFPSWELHRVTPVTEGTRHSLVAWITGKPFK